MSEINTASWSLRQGMRLTNSIDSRIFEVTRLDVNVTDLGTRYQEMNVEVDLQNIETGAFHKHMTVNGNFFNRYKPV